MKKLTKFFTAVFSRYLPDPFTIAIGLTVLTIILAITVRGTGLMEVTNYWGSGFWDLLEFTMQMTLILLLGYVLAKAPLVDRTINFMISRIKRPSTAIIVATLFGGIGSLLNWGFGLIIGGIVAQKLAIKVKGVHYPLIIAAGYSGFALYGSGISGTVPVTIATPGHFLEEQMGLVSTADTIFSLPMIISTLTILITLPLLNAYLQPKKKEEIIEIDPAIVRQVEGESDDLNKKLENDTFAQKMNNSSLFGLVIGVLGLIYVFNYFSNGGSIDLNIVNFTMLFLGILLMRKPSRYLNAVADGVKTVSGIIIQYPFYAGIMGILVGSGLITSFASFFVSISNESTLPFWSLISAFFINILAPSGGGQWAVQGPVMIEAAKSVGASVEQVAMAVMLGDAWNNMIQPFWILPVLAISKLPLKSIMGYMVIIMLWLGVVHSIFFLLWGFLT